MAEVRLGDIRIGFAYSVDINFPPGFLAAPESVRMKLRRHLDDAAPIVMASSRTGDTVSLSLTAAQTTPMQRGNYIGEAVVFQPAFPAVPEIPLTNNRYIADCDLSPSR